jgi:hypothetical protein
MTPEQTLTYNKFVTAVTQNKPNTVAELLYLHPFLLAELESSIDEEKYISPFIFATANPERLELATVLRAFGADIKFESKYYPVPEITPYQEIYTPPIEDNPTPFIPEEIAPELKNLVAQDLNELKTEITKKYHLEPLKQLYILTGEAPINCDRTINANTKGPHLRFILPKEGKRLDKTKTLLKAFGIPYCDGFGSETSRYLTIAPEAFKAVNQNFTFSLNHHSEAIKLGSFFLKEQEILLNIFPSHKYQIGLIDRNHNQYSLDTLLLKITKFNFSNSPGFKYLEKKGHVFEHQIAFSQEESQPSSPEEVKTYPFKADEYRMLYFTADSPPDRKPAAPIAGRAELTKKTHHFLKK